MQDAFLKVEKSPRYADERLSNFCYIREFGPDRLTDRHYFTPGLFDRIATPSRLEDRDTHFHALLLAGARHDGGSLRRRTRWRLAHHRCAKRMLHSNVFQRN